MLNIFSKIIDCDKILDFQNLQYTEKLLIEDEVAANQMEMASVNVSSLGHFYSVFITGKFTTIVMTSDNGNHPIDSGYCYLRGKLIDGSNSRPLFNSHIPLDLFLSPGRTKAPFSMGFLTDPISNSLFYPQPFAYMFGVNSDIQFEVKNDSTWMNKYWMVFHGIRFPASQKDKRNKYVSQSK